MRWERLFTDMEAQLEAADRLGLDDDIAVRTQRERKTVHLAGRMRLDRGAWLDLRVAGVGPVRAVLCDLGPDWMLFGDEAGAELLVPSGALIAVQGLGVRAAVNPTGADRQMLMSMGLAFALEAISRDRSVVAATVADGTAFTGMIDRVGADFIDLVTRIPGEPRSGYTPRGVAIPLAQLSLVRRV
ncbi:hypothetical protein G1H11_18605 [Phytoactinopolyspora alkaliphila]|uniref:Uncharacterized protein n=1 Tax=Phytoactinopolyspora alkaliphila TaxID=1783498 RepID=A0A6N9YQM0_9ACTN|nr:hypothetical protein [Phytoactinopolyspora alkaliphila]NED97313.1 hypothetical protein [Phytoactinopolyspora alkaliphila]